MKSQKKQTATRTTRRKATSIAALNAKTPAAPVEAEKHRTANPFDVLAPKLGEFMDHVARGKDILASYSLDCMTLWEFEITKRAIDDAQKIIRKEGQKLAQVSCDVDTPKSSPGSFADLAERAAAALADLISHPDCPDDLVTYVSQFNDNVVNDFSHLALDLSTRFPRAVCEAAEDRRERPALMAA